ncbi:MAG: T9SS type A sorting domain-containing protein [Bacteroidota bacterium]
MKTQVILLALVSLLIFLFQGFAVRAQRAVPIPVNDTVDITPYIPVTVNILANDTIPAGDSVGIVFVPGGVGSVTSTINTGGNVTFILKRWGYSGPLIRKYKIRDYTQGLLSDTASVIFNVHDQSFAYLDINNVSARFSSSGLHFFEENAEYEVPKGSGKTSIFDNSLWVGGIDAGNLLHFAGERYRQGANGGPAWTRQDYWAGPVSDSAAYNIYQDTVWNYIWKINRSEIEYHRNHYWEPGYEPIKNILTWPAHGNTALGQAALLAPFSDRNANGLYEPWDGDYPEIRGDQALFFIYNDDHGYHAESAGEKLKVEIHGMAYAFDRPNDTAFKNTTFLHCKVINRSQNTYTGTWFGVFTDIDLGYANDDYVGCDPERGMYYGYNGTPVDGTGQSYAYGANPPAQAVVILGGPTMDMDGYDNPSFRGSSLYGPSFKGSCDIVYLNGAIINMNYGPGEVNQAPFLVRSDAINGIKFGDGITDNERYGMRRFVYHNNSNSGVPSYMTDPVYAPEYYQIMQGIWKDNSKMIYGGNGHFAAGGFGPECDFMFPGLTDTCDWGINGQPPNGPKEWTERTAKNNPQDRRGTASTGPFTFKPGDVQEIDIAFAWARNYNPVDSTGSLNKLNAVVDTIRKAFNTNSVPGGSPFYGINDREKKNSQRLKIYPNPANDVIFVEIPGRSNGEIEISLLSNMGKILYSKTSPSRQVHQIDVAKFPPGFYLIQVKSGANVWIDKALISK